MNIWGIEKQIKERQRYLKELEKAVRTSDTKERNILQFLHGKTSDKIKKLQAQVKVMKLNKIKKLKK